MKNLRPILKLSSLAIAMLLCMASLTAQTTHIVDDDIGVDNGTSPFATITAAINAAVDGDIIDITGGADNTHTEQGITVAKSLTIRGQGQSTTIVQAHPTPGMATDRVFYVNGTNLTVKFEDFTVRHGVAAGGGGISCAVATSDLSFSRMTITKNKISANRGGGIAISGATTCTLSDCVISHNEANKTVTWVQGGGLSISGSSSGQYKLNRCTVAYNECGATGGGIIVVTQRASIIFSNCTIYKNTAGFAPQPFGSSYDGGGVFVSIQNAGVTFINCTVAENKFASRSGLGTNRGGGIAHGFGSLRIINSVVANNTNASPGFGNDLRYTRPSGPIFVSSLVRSCAGCKTAPTYFSDPKLAPPATCGEQIYLEPQAGSDALDNGTTVVAGFDIPLDDICGKIRVAPHDLGSYDKSGIVPPPPVANCKDITVALDAGGMGAIAASDVDNGSNAALGISAMTVSPNTFDCNDLGTNSVTLTVTDNLAATDDCMATVTVTSPNDATPPTITCPSTVVKINADATTCSHAAVGTTLDPLPITDDCHVASITNDFNGSSSLAGAVFPFGKTTVTWTVTDGNGNTATCTYDVRIRDKTAPVFAKCQPDTTIKVAAGITGHVFDPMLSDNCTAYGDLTITGFPLPGSFFPIGTTSVVWTAKDKKNNTGSCTMNIKVETTAQAPTGWSSNTIGTLTQCVTNYDATTKKLTIKTNGGSVFNSNDNFCGITKSTSLTNIDLRARVTHTGSSSTDQAGIMFRQSLATNSAQTSIVLNGSGVPTVNNRATAGAFTLGTSGTAVTKPYYIRLHLLGPIVTGYVSANGTSWTSVGSYPSTLSSPLFLSLFATSSATNGTATFDNITLNGSALRFADEMMAEELMINAFPNPVHDQLNVALNAPAYEQVQLSLANAMGQRLIVHRFEADANGQIERRLEVGDLAAGVYLLEVRTATESRVVKVMKK